MLLRCSFFLLLSFATGVFAQVTAPNPTYPSGTVKIVSPFATGGIADTFARVIAQHLSEAFHQPFIVENKTGGGGNIGADLVAKAAPNGYTLVIHPSIPADSVSELIALIKARPGKIAYGSGGVGTSGHLAGELFKSTANVDMVHVPYKGNTLAINDLIGGQTQVMFATMPTVLPFVKSGKLKALAVIGPSRASALPQVPTVAETLPGFEVTNWIGLFAPAGTPPDIVNKLNAEVIQVMQEPAVQERLAAEGATFSPMTPKEFGAFQQSESDKWAGIVRGLKFD